MKIFYYCLGSTNQVLETENETQWIDQKWKKSQLKTHLYNKVQTVRQLQLALSKNCFR